MKNLKVNQMEILKGGICASFPGNTDQSIFGDGCFSPCLLASSMGAPFFCIL